MDESDTETPQLPVPTVTVEREKINRQHIHDLQQHPCLYSSLASVVSTFLVGVGSGAPGGLMFGLMAVVLLQSLELLAENKLLMDSLENYITNTHYFIERLVQQLLWGIKNDPLHDTHISILAEAFGVLSSFMSVTIGVFCGLSTYARVHKKEGGEKKDVALGLAGLACITAATVIGFVLGQTLEGFLSLTPYMFQMLSMYILVPWLFVVAMIGGVLEYIHIGVPVCFWLGTPYAALLTFLLSFLSKSKLVLIVTLFPNILALSYFAKKHDFVLIFDPVLLTLIVTDVYTMIKSPIIFLQPPSFRNTSDVVLEDVFVGILTSHLLVVAVGMTLFVSWENGGAGKICAGAATLGSAVLGVIKFAVPVLGPGPSIGILVGVAGAVGVSLSAAGAATDRYGNVGDNYRWVGRLGVTVGAAVGAFLGSHVHNGVSNIFVSLCAAMIAGGPEICTLLEFLHTLPTWWCFKLSFQIIVLVLFLTWVFFTYTSLSIVTSLYVCFLVLYAFLVKLATRSL